ncbi:RNA methyltransferase [Carnimonas bestiolae]|uniref:RNA methyltransferase n=1 Tax=Carnimonas bestiolae TaxID=3402172 RepID=UPI003EDB76CA
MLPPADNDSSWLSRISIVLVGTSHPGNVGGAVRAMKTMGLSQLVLVAPRCDPYTSEAVARASGADELIQAAQRFGSLEEALTTCSWVVGCSARTRTMPWPMITPRRFSLQLEEEVARGAHDSSIAIVFGREDSGLTNDELARCNTHVHIPTSDSFGSLNLAAAVQLMAYESRQAWLEASGDSEATALSDRQNEDAALQQSMQNVEWDNPLASHADVERLLEHFERTLIATGFHDPEHPRQLMARLRRLLLRARLDSMETNILRGILSSVDKLTPPSKS